MTIKHYVFLFLISCSRLCAAQEISSRSNEIPVDFRSPTEIQSGSVPRITWLNPKNDNADLKAGQNSIRVEIWSNDPLKRIFLFVRDRDTKSLKATIPLLAPDSGKSSLTSEKNITLEVGNSLLEILAENETGFKSISRREVHVK